MAIRRVKIWQFVTQPILSKMLSYRREIALRGTLVLDKSGKLELGDNISRTGLSSTTVILIGLQIYWIRWKKTQNKGDYAVQGHRGRYQSKARMRSRTVSKLSQHVVQILDTAFLSNPLGGLRDNVRCSCLAHWKACSGLPISVNWTFCPGVTAEAWRAKIDRKWAISLQRSQFNPIFQVDEVAPTNHIGTCS